MAENKIQIHLVKGISKKNGSPWYAVQVDLPTISGGYRSKMAFLNTLELEVCGLKPENFEQKN